ncbi:MAG: hypothetical protein CMJ26_06200 [Phycisphaerae bacterium]|nr:hypothetical protein [Phycisphaerae bacterium]|tara:strand:- start:8380 stop:8817 length:438 start_codon:yes stop_codon:yes gene_type:complete
MEWRGKPSSSINANLTPMIDVTFLLIVFFVVVSQIVDRDAVSMDLPSPENAAASVAEMQERVVVNIVPSDGGAVQRVVVGRHEISIDSLDELTAIVKTRLQGGASEVYLRADRATRYMVIHKAIEAIRKVGTTPRLQLVIDGDNE